MQRIALSHREPFVARLMQKAGYTGHKIQLEVRSSFTMNDTAWDSGRKARYVAVNLETMQAVHGPQFDPPQFGGPRLGEVEIPLNTVVVRVQEGGYEHATIMVREENAAPLLPSPVGGDLTWAERVVLVATRSLKPFARLENAKEETGIKEADYEQAKASLIAKKLLNKAGAITVDGLNIAADIQLHHLGAEVGYDRWKR